MEAGKRTIRDIFNRGRNLEIPFFQRSYVWGEKQWERFLDDMRLVSAIKKPYFLGSIILKQQETTSDQDSRLTVIDGQQRLTTLNIFMKVLALKLDIDTDFTQTFKKQRDKSIILLHNHLDQDSFNWVVNLTSLEELDHINDSDNILKAYKYFSDNVAIESNEYDFYYILDKILLVGIDLTSGEDEQQIFDTINSLGVRLTSAELLKNHLFSRDDLESYDAYWKEVFERDDDTKSFWDTEVTTGRLRRSFIDIFFYNFLQIQIQNPSNNIKSEDKIEFSKVDNLFESYKKFLAIYSESKNQLLQDIKAYAAVFRKHLDNTVVERELSADNSIERMNALIFGFDTSTLISYFLYVLINQSDTEKRDELFDFIENYLLRRFIVGATTKNYNNLFNDSLISNEILTKEQLIAYIGEKDSKVNYFPSDHELQEGFKNSSLVNKQTAAILYFIESKIRDRKKHSTSLLGLKKYSLEHIMPKKWRNNWPHPDSEEDKQKRDRILKTLGNLTIITQSLNTSIRDADWDTKKHGRKSRKGLVHYSSGIETLTPYLDKDNWSETEILDRAKDLYNLAISIYPSVQ